LHYNSESQFSEALDTVPEEKIHPGHGHDHKSQTVTKIGHEPVFGPALRDHHEEY